LYFVKFHQQDIKIKMVIMIPTRCIFFSVPWVNKSTIVATTINDGRVSSLTSSMFSARIM
jgi:hypothetical protein